MVAGEADQKTVRVRAKAIDPGDRLTCEVVFPTNALALMVQTELKLDPHSGINVIFRSKRGTG